MKRKANVTRIILSVILLVTVLDGLPAQDRLQKPPRRTANHLDADGPFLKTIYSFVPAYYDTIAQPGTDPILLAKYRESDLIPVIFNAVFNAQVKVYDPNFWGSVPQLIEKQNYKEFDTLKILNYLSAGWDTSLMIEDDGSMKNISKYRNIPCEEISGIFFYESWWLDRKTSGMYKDILAYLPIREYTSTVYDGYDDTEVRRRLLFMVLPEWISENKKPVKYRSGEFRLIKKDVHYEFLLYNKSYEEYLYREEEYSQIGREEFNEWQYHQFDFYRHFDPDIFLEKIITGVLDEKIQAYHVGPEKDPFHRDEFIKLLFSPSPQTIAWDEISGIPEAGEVSESDLLPENYPVSDLNSITFYEDWYIHPENLQIYKDVRGITINRTESHTSKPLFSVWF